MNKKKRQGMYPSADVLAVAIHRAILRDLTHAQRMPSVDQCTIKFLKESQKTATLKKFSVSSGSESSKLHAFLKFANVDLHMLDYDLSYRHLHDADTLSCSPRDRILIRARALMKSILPSFTEDEFFLHCKNSSGVSVGVKYSDTSNEAKFTFPITTTVSAKDLFDSYMRYDHSLSQAVKSFNGSDKNLLPVYQIEESSRSTTVPKTSTIDRLIAIEPTANMYLQQGAMGLMVKNMRLFGLDLSVLPDVHKQFAFEGSLSNELATIDFSSASDCMSVGLLEWLLPPQWFQLCMSLRTGHISIFDDISPITMYATMGNATTFPLETLTFFTILCASHWEVTGDGIMPMYKQHKAYKHCSVFGDDCIIPTESAAIFMDTCESVGFLVNREKSFFDRSNFRESCGGDFLHGRNVRPFYLKRPPSESTAGVVSWLYSTLNRYISFSRNLYGDLLYIHFDTISYLLTQIQRFHNNIFVVPRDYPSDAGLYQIDIVRFQRLFPKHRFLLPRKAKNNVFSFLYMNFKYRNKKETDDGIRYALALKKPPKQNLKPFLKAPIRKKGGYVVARGFAFFSEAAPLEC